MSDITHFGIADDDTYFADCPIPARIFEYRGKAVRVLDGDTCVVWLDEGDGRLLATKLRYEHVNAPELSAVGGPESRDFNRQLVVGKWVVVRTRSRREQNGRLIGDLFVWLGKNVAPLDVGKAIIEAGHGVRRAS